jgi:glucose-6-phosphate dehydrogenase assembly protein OpcA
MKLQAFALARTGVVITAIIFPAAPALAYWQFIERPPGVEVKPSPRYASKQACETAIKQVEAALKKAYPNRYPLVGSCEEYR